MFLDKKYLLAVICIACMASGAWAQPADVAKLVFPKGFIWAAGSAAYQVEGGYNMDGRGPGVWDKYMNAPYGISKPFSGKAENGNVAINQYDRKQFAADVVLMKQLGINTYRFSISWSRVLPQGTGAVNEKGIDYYNFVINALLKAGIQPMVTLYHWDMPLALAEKGGWMNRESVQWFDAYARLCFERFGDRVKTFTTFNEPSIELLFMQSVFEAADQHRVPEMPGGEKFMVQHMAHVHHLILAHATAVNSYHKMKLGGKIGITYNYMYCELDSAASPEGKKNITLANRVWNNLFIDPVFLGKYPEDVFARLQGNRNADIQPGDMQTIRSAKTDFLGVNFYGVNRQHEDAKSTFFGLGRGKNPDKHPMFNGAVRPEVLYKILLALKKEYSNPLIYITENGAGFGAEDDALVNGKVDDKLRCDYIVRHLDAIHKAIGQGVNVKGYAVWSMFDNLEWVFGYSRRFGITYVDFKTQQRIPKQSYYLYQSILKQQP